MESFAVEALIIKRKDFGEADKLITLFTKNKGKIVTLAKGVRKINSRRAASLELLNQSKIFLHQSKGLPLITEVELIKPFNNLKEHLTKISLTYLPLELIDQFLDEGEENNQIYQLLLDTLESIDKTTDLQKIKVLVSNFQLKLLTSAGFLPQLYQCVRCKKNLLPAKNYLAPYLGGIIDQDCNKEVLLGREVSIDAVKGLRFLEKEKIDKIARLSFSKKLIDEVSELLNFYTVFFLEKDLKSPNFASAVEKITH